MSESSRGKLTLSSLKIKQQAAKLAPKEADTASGG
jgi:hypothetical protein